MLEQQVRRMLADPRVDGARRQLRRPVAAAAQRARASRRIANLFPEFDENLREAFQQETELFVDSQLREDRSVVDLLTRRTTRS